MSTKTTKTAPKSNAKTTTVKGKKPTAKSTMTAAVATPAKTAAKPAAIKTVPIVNVMGQMIDTQEIANRMGRNWQFVNRQRHAGRFIDHSAVLKNGGTYLYKVSAVRQWAKENGYPFGSN